MRLALDFVTSEEDVLHYVIYGIAQKANLLLVRVFSGLLPIDLFLISWHVCYKVEIKSWLLEVVF